MRSCSSESLAEGLAKNVGSRLEGDILGAEKEEEGEEEDAVARSRWVGVGLVGVGQPGQQSLRYRTGGAGGGLERRVSWGWPGVDQGRG